MNKKIISAVSVVLVFALAFIFLLPVNKSSALNPSDRKIDSVAVGILAKHPGRNGVLLLDNYMRLFGYKRINLGEKDVLSFGAHAVPQYLNVSMYRYVYYGYPIKQKIFIDFDWQNQNYETENGPPDHVGISWDSTKYHIIDDYYTAYDDDGNSANNLMWLDNATSDTAEWGLYEKGFLHNGVDHGAGVVTLVNNNSYDSNVTTVYGKYLHIYNTGSVGISTGYPFVMQVTYSTGNVESWSIAKYLYGN